MYLLIKSFFNNYTSAFQPDPALQGFQSVPQGSALKFLKGIHVRRRAATARMQNASAFIFLECAQFERFAYGFYGVSVGFDQEDFDIISTSCGRAAADTKVLPSPQAG